MNATRVSIGTQDFSDVRTFLLFCSFVIRNPFCTLEKSADHCSFVGQMVVRFVVEIDIRV